MSKKQKMQRSAGILLPISSLPSEYGIGNFGKQAYDFVDYLKKSGQKLWQILPIGPTSFGDSPYQSFSAFAGNPYFIDFDKLIEEGLLKADYVTGFDWGSDSSDISYDKIYESRFKVLRTAFEEFKKGSQTAYEKFYKENEYWLKDYALYMSVKATFDNKSWLEWDDDIRLYKKSAVARYTEELSDDIYFWCFTQFKFYEQWFALKDYANENGIKIVGDIPIYVSMDSADTWACADQFLLDDDHRPTVVAGCPPDCFSELGQLWGNSIYDWKAMHKDGYKWWKSRIAYSAKIYDIIRIDHFIGIVRYYAIPAKDGDARKGKFHEGPGMKLIKAIDEARGDSGIIAEDLGVVTDAVKELMKRSGYPGMKILQHAWDGNPENEHLPINYEHNYCVYLGTHDNDTMAAAIDAMDNKKKKYLMDYIGKDNLDDAVWDLIRVAYSSVADTVLVQMQDILGLDNTARMNLPSTVGCNWRWRVTKAQLTVKISKKLKKLSQTYGR